MKTKERPVRRAAPAWDATLVGGRLANPFTPRLPLVCSVFVLTPRRDTQHTNRETDVDGVLHPLRTGRQHRFNSTCMEQLRAIVAAAAADGPLELVLSSSWRQSDTAAAAVDAQLALHGLPAVADRTPTFGVGERVKEILDFVDRARPRQWVALDDIHLEGIAGADRPRVAGRCVRTDGTVGLQPRDAALAIQILAGGAATGGAGAAAPPPRGARG